MLLLTKYTVLYKENEICCIILLSLPSRERGLKFVLHTANTEGIMSLPSRERGLKCLMHLDSFWIVVVAPFTGARIKKRMT